MNLKKLMLTGLLILFAVSCGDDSSGPSDALNITVTAPPAEGASAVDNYTVTWSSSSSGTVSLFYNDVAGPDGQRSIASGLSASGSYSWDLAGVPDGEFFVRAIITSGSSTGFDWSDGTLSVDHSSGDPAITVTTPPAEGASADTSFTVEWVSSGYSSGIVNIYVDTDTDPSSGLVELAVDLDDSGEFVWDCSLFAEGYYYVYATIEDSTQTNFDYSSGILAVDHGGLTPDFYITKPPAAGAQADNIYTIQWESTAPLNSTVDLYYDTDENPSSGLVEIEMDIFDDGYYSWDCSAVPEGSYYIYGVLETSTPMSRSERVLTLLHTGSKGTVVTDYSNGTLTIAHTGQYSIEVTEPPVSGATADESYQIVWETDAPSSEAVTLFYSADTTGSELFPLVSIEPPVGTSYNWNCSTIEEGSWYIYAVLGSRGMGSDWSAGQLTIYHQEEYSFTMITPPASGATANEEYLLQWQTDAPGSAYVSLYYGVSSQPGGTVYAITTGILNSGQYNWPCGSVPEGDYYVYGVVSDSRNPRMGEKGSGSDWSDGVLTVDHSGYSINIDAPSSPGEPADASYLVEWSASGASGCLIDLYYDEDTDPSYMTLIAAGLSDTGSHEWNTLVVGAGEYFVYGIIYDPADGTPQPGTDEYAQDYSEGTVLVSHEYNYLMVTSPPSWGAQAMDSYNIQWAAASQSGTGTVDVYYDTDTIPSSGLVSIASDIVWDEYHYTWDCSSIPAGYYYIYAEMENPAGTFTDYSDGLLQIYHEYLWFSITAPPPPGATANTSYQLKWNSVGPGGRTMDLYYDTDTEPSSGLVLIVEDVVCTDYTTTWTWDCSSVPEGTYYIYGILSDPVVDDQFTGYSEGMLTIDH
ncbi:MAG: hypothetical protein KAS73_12285 [Candidatus Sabulitectum sp.]|nr:hypothetical protein [Candidatus Sabulitectum sp.]